jgi:hypothetical protein
MVFYIQISNPEFNKDINIASAETLSEAIEDIFPMETEDAIINWNGTRIPLSYKYDISCICEDIIEMAERLLVEKKGNIQIEWPSNTFRATWDLTWEGNEIECSAIWHDVSGNMEEVLNCKNQISMSLDDFLSEWGSIIRKITDCLLASGFNHIKLPILERMKTINDKIKSPGTLYRLNI